MGFERISSKGGASSSKEEKTDDISSEKLSPPERMSADSSAAILLSRRTALLAKWRSSEMSSKADDSFSGEVMEGVCPLINSGKTFVEEVDVNKPELSKVGVRLSELLSELI